MARPAVAAAATALIVACTLAGVSARFESAFASSATAPWQIHLALAGRGSDGASNSMAVSWVTNATTATSTVQYGTSASALTSSATGASNSYYAPTVNHHVVLGTLAPATRYFYRCGDAAGGWSSVRAFTSAPAADSAISVMVVGDQGLYNSNDTVNLMLRTAAAGGVDFLHHLGDISYADDAFLHDPLKFGYEPTWNTYMQWIEPLTSAMPMMVMPGNHESECHSPICIFSKTKKEAFANFSAYNHRFRMPTGPDESNSGTNMWSSFDYGMVHFANIDTETDYPGAPLDDYFSKSGGFGRQLEWLDADLQRARANPATKWIIVSGHRPIYTLNGCNADGSITGHHLKLQAAIEGMLHKYKVDLYLAGHVHSYERSYPVFNASLVSTSYTDPAATVHMVVGTGGDTEGHSSYAGKPRPSWHAADNDQDFGMAIMSIDANTLSWKFMRGTNGTVADEFTITRTK